MKNPSHETSQRATECFVFCGQYFLLIERGGYVVQGYHLTDDGACPNCHHPIPGRWPNSAQSLTTVTHSDNFMRRPIRVRI